MPNILLYALNFTIQHINYVSVKLKEKYFFFNINLFILIGG